MEGKDDEGEEVVFQGTGRIVISNDIEVPKGFELGKEYSGFQVIVNKSDKPFFPQGHKPTVSTDWAEHSGADPIADLKRFHRQVLLHSYGPDPESRRRTFRLIRGGLETSDGDDATSTPGPGDPPVAS